MSLIGDAVGDCADRGESERSRRDAKILVPVRRVTSTRPGQQSKPLAIVHTVSLPTSSQPAADTRLLLYSSPRIRVIGIFCRIPAACSHHCIALLLRSQHCAYGSTCFHDRAG